MLQGNTNDCQSHIGGEIPAIHSEETTEYQSRGSHSEWEAPTSSKDKEPFTTSSIFSNWFQEEIQGQGYS